MKKLLLECLAVCLSGIALGLVANAVSPKRIDLGRNYFPPVPVVSAVRTNASTGSLPASTNAPGADALKARLEARGLTGVSTEQALQLWSDPRRAQGLIIFVDARDDDHYKEGHVPGAYQLDYYKPAAYLAAVLPAASVAEVVVIYCNGGDCEDSELTAVFLRDAGVAAGKLRVQMGGFMEWQAKKHPVEAGQQNSGQMLQQP